jgi:hypothetical protein
VAEPIKLFESADRNASHQHLEMVLVQGTHPKAECREDPNAAQSYQVWSDRTERVPPPPLLPDPVVVPPPPTFDMEALAELIAAKLKS